MPAQRENHIIYERHTVVSDSWLRNDYF